MAVTAANNAEIIAVNSALQSAAGTGTAVGLVLSGGGARAYCHMGAIKALEEARVPIDFVGGASMGAVVAAGPAMGWSFERLDFEIRRAFVESDPLSDLAFPIIAMSRARKVARLLERAYGDTDLADLCLPFFCVSSNLTSGRIEVHRRLGRILDAGANAPKTTQVTHLLTPSSEVVPGSFSFSLRLRPPKGGSQSQRERK